MSDFSNYLENALLEHVLGGTALAQPTTVYVALSDADPTEDGSALSEPSTGTWYSRQAVSFTFNNDGSAQNSSAVDFGTADASFNASHFALYDAATGGNMLYHSALDQSKAIANGDGVQFQAGALTVTHS